MGKIVNSEGKTEGFDCDLCGEKIRDPESKAAYEKLIKHLNEKHPKQDGQKAEYKAGTAPAKTLEDRVADLERQLIKIKEALV